MMSSLPRYLLSQSRLGRFLWLILLPLAGCELIHEVNYTNQKTASKFARTARMAERSQDARRTVGSRDRGTVTDSAVIDGKTESRKTTQPSEKSAEIVQAKYEQASAPEDIETVPVPPKRQTAEKAPLSRIDLKVRTLTRRYPIDLPTALRLGDADNLQIGLARERISAAEARLEGAEALWLPSLTAGTTYQFHVGQIQRAPGQVIEQNRNSLGISAGPNLGVDLADAIYEPLIQEQRLQADTAAAATATNDILLRIASAYIDLLAANATHSIATEARANALDLARVTKEFAGQGVGLRSDAERAATELGQREQQIILAQERVTVASATLAQLLRLDPQMQLIPLEQNVVPVELIAEVEPLSDLVAHALHSRPELREQQALVDAACQRLEKAKYGPLIPSVILGYQAGGFGGGPGAYFGNFSDREDLTIGAMWELQNLGFGNRAEQRLRQSELNQSQLRSLRLADVVASEVVSAHQVVVARRKQIDVAKTTVLAAIRSQQLNQTRIRGGSGLPIEVLQSIQALERSRSDYLQAVSSYNKAQFTLLTSLGKTPYSPEVRATDGPEPTPAPAVPPRAPKNS